MTKRQDIFKIGDRIELIREEPKTIKYYPSQLLDITKYGTYIVSGPIYKNRLVILHKNEKIKVSYIVKNKGRYAFDAKILKRYHGKIYKLELIKTSDIKKYQKREYYRFETFIPVIKEFIVKTKDVDEVNTELCRTKDISGSGIKLYSNLKHNVGDIIKCKFEIKRHSINVKCMVLRVEIIDTFDYSYSLGINFIDIREEDRDIIIKFIFEEERILREKGLI